MITLNKAPESPVVIHKKFKIMRKFRHYLKGLAILMVIFALGFEALAQRGRNGNSHHHKHTAISQAQHKHKHVAAQQTAQIVQPYGRAISHRSGHYFYNHGNFYRHNAGRYTMVPAPLGIRVSVLPPNPWRVVIRGQHFFYSNGAFFSHRNNCYQVTSAPVGAIVPSIPMRAQRLSINGREFFEFDQTIYQRIRTRRGIAYEVVGRSSSLACR